MNRIIKGRDLMLFDNDGHSYAYATNHTFTFNAETTDISSKDHGMWGASEISRFTWELSSENLYTEDGYDKMYDAMITATPIKVRFGLKQPQTDMSINVADGNTALPYWTSQNSYYSGYVLVTSLVANANNGENATYSTTLTGTGALVKTTASAQTYTLSVAVASGQSSYGSVAGGGVFEENTTHIISATPSKGYKFQSWSDGNLNATRSIRVVGNLSLTASFAPENED